ncbi:MAG: Sapep family Mn(2+)-dependent dipeptidase [Clostridiales bacterium]|jgi:succinyl-diaminopimelate desuccinylase|nr:Sapep family Mn(2+)-dependent dipeptidase [Clostridiales bacterium]
MIQDLARLIGYNSTLGEAQPNAPFGQEVANALDWILSRAEQYGLDTVNKHKYGYCQYDGNDTNGEIVGALCHLDIVPAGELSKWDSNPFELTIKDGIMYGRGVTDNKGAAVAVLHALKRLKDNNIKLKRHARLIFGCNEETDMSCIRSYVANEVMPVCSFVPDADFPIINSEKGIMQFDIILPIPELSKCIEISGGTRPNMIPETCEVLIVKGTTLYDKLQSMTGDKLSQILDQQGALYSLKQVDRGYIISAQGVSGHAMAPHKGRNAIMMCFAIVAALGNDTTSVDTQVLYKLHRLFNHDDFKHKVGLIVDCPDSGNLTLNPGLVCIQEGKLHLTVDARMPKVLDDQMLLKIFERAMSELSLSVDFKIREYKPGLFVDKQDRLVSTLLSIYTRHTGLPGVCIKSGGGTYARQLRNAVAFGPRFVGVKTDIHSPNEQYPQEDLYKLVDIYYDSFIELCGVAN